MTKNSVSASMGMQAHVDFAIYLFKIHEAHIVLFLTIAWIEVIIFIIHIGNTSQLSYPPEKGDILEILIVTRM